MEEKLFIDFAVHFLLLCSFYSTTHIVFLLGKCCTIIPCQLNYACTMTSNRCYTREMITRHAQGHRSHQNQNIGGGGGKLSWWSPQGIPGGEAPRSSC